jgi:hypothetical protein
MQNRTPIMLNAIGEGTSKAQPGYGGKCRYGAFGFFPVPLQGTQTFRCPRALMLPAPRQWGHASCSARAFSEGGTIRFPKVISSSFNVWRDSGYFGGGT